MAQSPNGEQMDDSLPILELGRLRTPPDECGYLPDERSEFDYRALLQLSSNAYERMLELGWRRHGMMFFRPVCSDCDQCVSLRVRVPEFRPTRSQRKNLRRNAGVRLEIGRPQLTSDHVRLFNEYHAEMQQLRGWPAREESAEDYFESFLRGDFEFEREFRYWRDDQLIGVGLVDATARATSSIYFYHAPDWRADGPGTFSILNEIEFARSTGREHFYLGYWIESCGSMSYKSRFQPHELLHKTGDAEPIAAWQPVLSDT